MCYFRTFSCVLIFLCPDRAVATCIVVLRYVGLPRHRFLNTLPSRECNQARRALGRCAYYPPLEGLTQGTAVISFHSLEDREVKNFLAFCSCRRTHYQLEERDESVRTIEADSTGLFASFIADGHVITPYPDEQTMNPRSRSAKLRIAERTSSAPLLSKLVTKVFIHIYTSSGNC